VHLFARTSHDFAHVSSGPRGGASELHAETMTRDDAASASRFTRDP
jgi:hypothetical protein